MCQSARALDRKCLAEHATELNQVDLAMLVHVATDRCSGRLATALLSPWQSRDVAQVRRLVLGLANKKDYQPS
jgi:hypothetical protein